MSTSQSTLERTHSFGELPFGELAHANARSTISEQVEQHMARLETKLLEEFKELGQRAVEKTARSMTDRLSDLIQALEQFSAFQSRSIVDLKNSSRAAEQKLSGAVRTIERTSFDTVAGGLQFESAAGAGMPAAAHVYCPNRTSTRIRRAYRQGVWEEVLRLFFLAPFRCRSCRHKFYRF